MSTIVRPMGDAALLAEVDSLDAVLALHATLSASRPDGVMELVPAARTVLVRVDPARLPLAAARTWIERTATEAGPAVVADPVSVVLDVVYDGADLDDAAELLGLSRDALVSAHTAARWRVAFTGFAPGFGYLVSADWPYRVPRLASPRPRVPAGSVALAAEFSGAYPRETPGGWRLIGRTSARLFDPDAASDSGSPVLLAPGAQVRFRAVPAAALASSAPPGSAQPSASGTAPSATRPTVRILEPGLLTTVQDLGRPGRAHLGIARSGAVDRAALRRANRLVGNPEDAAAFEIAMGGFRATATADAWFAVTGAWGEAVLDGKRIDPDVAHAWPAGAELHLDWFARGARAYLAVRGGLDVPPAVGSRSCDTLAGLGPAPLRARVVVPVGAEPPTPIPANDLAPWGPPPEELVIAVTLGPRADWFAPSALSALFEDVWTVGAQADRVGIRLEGPALERTGDGPHGAEQELPSEGMVPGAMQVPPKGGVTILLADGPVTGGYPVIAVVADSALDLLGQARQGTRIRFRHAR
ncbi:5-oxoprolinase subunit B/C family protein [Microbacterium xylanilyticum]